MNERVKSVLNTIVEKFKTGEIPEAVALASFPVPDIPSARWSFTNRTLMFLSGTADARGFHAAERCFDRREIVVVDVAGACVDRR